ISRAGNCVGCHTAPGGALFAGGRSIRTPFGDVYSTNLTPDPETGIGNWTTADFWRALHHGRSKDGRRLYPAFPYPSYTYVTREDADAIFAYLMSLPPVASPRVEPALRFPYDSRFALQVWRALYFRPAAFEPDAEKDETWKDRKSTRLNSSHVKISYAVFCLKKKRRTRTHGTRNAKTDIRHPHGCTDPPAERCCNRKQISHAETADSNDRHRTDTTLTTSTTR